MNRKQIALITSRVSIAVLASGLLACSGDKKNLQSPREAVANVAVIAAQRTSVPDYIESTGTVRAAESAQLSAQVLASIVAVNVHEGDRVRKGQILVVLNDAQFRSATDRAAAAELAAEKETVAAAANYNFADATLKRYQNLFGKKSVSPQEFDEVKARYEAAQARVEIADAGQAQARAALAEARTMQGYTRLIAPFDGIITEKRIEAGNLASPGMPILTVENTGRYRLDASINEMDIAAVRMGMIAPVQIEALTSEPIQAKVVEIVPSADSASRSFVVKLDLPTVPNLRSGLFGRVSIPKGNRDTLLVPRTAVLERGQLQAVYVIGKDKVATLRYVTLGRTQTNSVEVLSGIDSGEQLVADPGQHARSGKAVGVQQ